MNGADFSREFNKQSCHLLKQSLQKIEHCLGQLDDEQCWWRPGPGLNSIGNLLLHINGNLRQWAISGCSGDEDSRDRSAEFSADRNARIDDLLRLTAETVAEATAAIEGIEAQRLLETITIQGFSVTVLQAIVHTTAHFQGHTHQIIMLTRMQLGDDYRYQWTPDQPRGELPM